MINFHDIILMASKTPSGDNIQPWFFKSNEAGKTLSIYHDHKAAIHSFNPSDIASNLSFGMMLLYIEDEALRQGFEMTYEVHDDGLTNGETPFIICTFKENVSGKKPSFSKETTLSRSIGRGTYVKNPIPSETMENFLNDLNKENELMKFSFSKQFTPESIKSMKRMEHIFWNKEHCLRDIFKWVFFSLPHYEKVRKGFYWKELSINFGELSFIFFVKKMTKLSIVLFNLFVFLMVFNKFNKSLKNANFVMLSLKKKPTPSEWLLVGRSVMKLWLRITELGMVVQPMSIHSFFISFSRWGVDNNNWSPEVISSLEGSLSNNFKVGKEYMPFWLYRFGYADKGDTTFRSYRMPIDALKKT